MKTVQFPGYIRMWQTMLGDWLIITFITITICLYKLISNMIVRLIH